MPFSDYWQKITYECCSVSSAPCCGSDSWRWTESARWIVHNCTFGILWPDIIWYHLISFWSVSKVLRWWIHLGERVLLGLVPSGQESGRLLVRCWAHGAAERLGLRWGRKNVKAKLPGFVPKNGKWHVVTCGISMYVMGICPTMVSFPSTVGVVVIHSRLKGANLGILLTFWAFCRHEPSLKLKARVFGDMGSIWKHHWKHHCSPSLSHPVFVVLGSHFSFRIPRQIPTDSDSFRSEAPWFRQVKSRQLVECLAQESLGVKSDPESHLNGA